MAINGVSAALSAVQRQLAAFDRAVADATRVGLRDALPGAAGPTDAVDGDNGAQPIDDIGRQLIARHAFNASIRIARVANENILTVLAEGGHEVEQA